MRRLQIIWFFIIFILTNNCNAQLTTKSSDDIQNLYNDYNFGIIVYNKEYQIYRSQRLGKEGIEEIFSVLQRNGYKPPKTIISMNFIDYSFLFPHSIEEDLSQLEYGYTYYHAYDSHFRTYIDGHNPLQPSDDIDDFDSMKFWERPTAYAKERYSISQDGKLDGGVDAFYRILTIILNPQNQPVLFHCHGGLHRTGMVAMAIRYLQGGDWTKRIYNLDPSNLLSANNQAKREYLKYNPYKPRLENFSFIEEITAQEEFKSLVGIYRNQLNY